MHSKVVRTRFAPSPTGLLHVGGIRTALFAWLVARQANGQFILRLEDTDKVREVEGAAQHIQDSLTALGIDWDEGPITQSDNLEQYKQWAQQLIDAGRAYADPYTPEEVQTFREKAQENKKPFLYRDHRPNNPPTWDASQPLRFKSEPKAYTWHDEVFGDLSSGPEAIDDFILIKSDRYPTYNFAHIVDDAEMKISHVIRGQEYLPSIPNYLNLYEALDLDRPLLATMPHILGPDGKKKLSKRDGAKDVLDYLREGYLAEAFVNFIASLGWNDGSEQEIFSKEELIKKFNLAQVQRSGARFDERRLLWMNGQYIARLSNPELLDKLGHNNFWPDEAKDYDDNYKQQVAGLIKLRLRTLGDTRRLSMMFFTEPKPEAVDELMKTSGIDEGTAAKLFRATIEELAHDTFSEESLKQKLNALLVSQDTKPAILFSIIRIAVSGEPYSPELFASLAIIGKEKTLKRLKKTIDILAKSA